MSFSATPARAPRVSPAAEAARLALVGLGIFLCYGPYLTVRRLGGVDAAWYATALQDYLHQWRALHLPALSGEGASYWNGGIHPFRSAPMLMIVAGLVDLVSWGQGGAYAVQHACVWVSACAGAFGFYALAVRLAPAHRWAGALLALAYLMTPSWLDVIVGAEAYMSFMAFGILPLILYAHARTLISQDGGGFTALGVGLALLWSCHPPIAMLTTLASVLIQTASIIVHRQYPWGAALRAVGWFACLSAYYFGAMSELPPRPGYSQPWELLQVIGLCVAVVGFARFALQGYRAGWAIVGAVGLGIVALRSTPWLVALASAFAFALLLSWVLRKWGRGEPRRGALEVIALSLVLGCLVGQAFMSARGDAGINPTPSATLLANSKEYADILTPLGEVGILRPGLAIMLIALGVTVGITQVRSPAFRIIWLGGVFLSLTYFRLPWVSDFIVATFPGYLAVVCNLGFCLRVIPVIVSLAALGGVFWFREVGSRRPAQARAALGLLALSLGVGLVQVVRFAQRERVLTAAPEYNAKYIRADETRITRYAYDLVPVPSYTTDGITDPRLECRLISAEGRVILAPDDQARAAEFSGSRSIPLKASAILNTQGWYSLSRAVSVPPGKSLLLRFLFRTDHAYSGWLFLASENEYREYQLPSSGFERSFGSGQKNSRVILLWNSGKETEHFEITYRPSAGDTLTVGDDFGSVRVSGWEPDCVPIAVRSLNPLTIDVDAPVDGFVETCRVFLPGYRAWVDGVEMAVSESRESLVQVPVGEGHHTVVVRRGVTLRVACALLVTLSGWCALGFMSLGKLRQRRRRT